MRVAIAGSGPTGANIGAALAGKDGIEVKYASRDPTSERIRTLIKEQVGNSADSVEAALQWADVVIIATPSMEDDETIKAFASKLEPFVEGKVVVDSTNPLSPPPAAEWRWRQGTSCGEVLAACLPGAYVYKGFNSLGQKHLSQGAAKLMHDQRLSLLFAGPAEKRDVVAAVISAAGFRPYYVGGIRYARNLEVMAELWHHLALPSWGSVPSDLSVEWGYNFHFQVVSDRN